MKHENEQVPVEQFPVEGTERQWPEYESPQVMTLRGQEMLEELGPAQACSFNHSVLLC
jgi:hypothetical protein